MTTHSANTTERGFEMGCTWSDMHEMSNNFLMMKNQTFIDKIQTENLRDSISKVTLACSSYTKHDKNTVIGEWSEPHSDKLGGEICIATRALVCIYTSTECKTLKGERRMIFILLLLTTIRTGESIVLVVKMPCRYLY